MSARKQFTPKTCQYENVFIYGHQYISSLNICVVYFCRIMLSNISFEYLFRIFRKKRVVDIVHLILYTYLYSYICIFLHVSPASKSISVASNDADTERSDHPPPPLPTGTRPMRGRYASYWNAFLFVFVNMLYF